MKFSIIYLIGLFFGTTVLAQNTQHKLPELKRVDAKVFYVKLEGNVSVNPVKEYKFSKNLEKGTQRIRLYGANKFQTLEGIGGAFNEHGGEALFKLTEKEQAKVYNNLFGENKSAFTFCRTAMGASDFGLDAYSYSEKEGDYEMNYFTFKREDKFVTPYIQGAFKVNPDLKLFASPWSPPAWMKHCKRMDIDSDENVLINDPKIYDAYAKYFMKYIQAYAERGINVSRINIQNETDSHPSFPGCFMGPDQMAHFAKNYLIPEFGRHHLETEIYAGTFRTTYELHSHHIMQDKDLRKVIDGVGFQYAKDFHIRDFKRLFPEVPIMHTEGKCFRGENTWEQAATRLKEVVSYINAGTTNYCYWNMILNETGTSAWGWKQNSLININRKTGEVTYNPDYAVIHLYSHFLRPGDTRIAFIGKNITMTAVERPDGSYVALIHNGKKEAVQYHLVMDNKYDALIELPANADCAVVVEKG
ncbi:glycoside hydrolase family 30 protein [Flavivirga algicola]|uniref:Glycoside hydrolase family 30 protein n=1 Tax=Flavivirga algicola TaxID=2729136 RepID=A0ABX1S1V7_9FLAO|nr:glycoside hydrolase family 30 beta sandwich domain-containing protein [Flavivirga algicola]NMH89865.1 glycoside hydrolase family 30 protein [Flavivirga algicola]